MASVRYLDRKLLRNIIRHTETHNRLQEEDDMWRCRAERAFGWGEPPFSSQRWRGREFNRDRFGGQMERLQRMNPDSRGPQNSSNLNRDIYRAELANNERWGHTGFMELYPDEFINKDSMDEMSNGEDKEENGNKKIKRKHKRKHKSRRELSSKQHKESESSSSSFESDISSASSDRRHIKTSTARKKARRSRHGERAERPREHRRVPSIDGSANRHRERPEGQDSTSHHKGAPVRSTSKSDQWRGSFKNRSSVDGSGESRSKVKNRKVNRHKSRERLHPSPVPQTTNYAVDSGPHRRRTADRDMEHKRDRSNTREKKREKELAQVASTRKSSDWSPERGGARDKGRDTSRGGRAEKGDRSDASSHHHKSYKKANKQHESEKEVKHSRRR